MLPQARLAEGLRLLPAGSRGSLAFAPEQNYPSAQSSFSVSTRNRPSICGLIRCLLLPKGLALRSFEGSRASAPGRRLPAPQI